MIRDATPGDGAQIAAIYAPYVRDTCISFELAAPGEAEMRARIGEHLQNYPYLVLEEDGRVTGYAYAGAYKARRAYAHTVEASVYVRADKLGGGRGALLMNALLDRLRADARFYTCVACVTQGNARSEKLFARLGFRLAGEYENVGWKMGAWRGVKDFILPLKPYTAPPEDRAERMETHE